MGRAGYDYSDWFAYVAGFRG
ncbi:hypothetical protein BN11_2780002 [Nostocoides australiense Ben110]|uniref:Uncharacterized protein n=1 Tax=Nostocoides australiense Ben110 TaxID=1193182 RepID=W6JWI8_9MICO|nr:hypothetical protein BN11_2780002 [Tetrasphaera australiensis Ben110]